MKLPDVRTLVPHAEPMMLLDRLLSVDEDNFCAEVVIRKNSLFCSADGVGAWVGIEYMAQTIAAHAGYAASLRGEPIKIGFLLGSRHYACHRDFFPIGSALRIYVQCVLLGDNGLGSFECRIEDDSGEIATATITVFQPVNASEFLEGLLE